MSVALLDPPEIKLLQFLSENYSFLFGENKIPLEDLNKNLRIDFTNLFVLSSPPYESVLLDKSGYLNSKITDNVNDFFRHSGFNPSAKNIGQKFHSVLSMDHISVELEFMSHLAKNQHKSLSEENENEYYKWLNLAPGKTIVDLGSGYCHWINYCKKKGVIVKGINLSIEQKNACKKK